MASCVPAIWHDVAICGCVLGGVDVMDFSGVGYSWGVAVAAVHASKVSEAASAVVINVVPAIPVGGCVAAGIS
jgi:hypothetical protein